MIYKLVRPITPRVIFDHLNSSCPEGLSEFGSFLRALCPPGHTYSPDSQMSQSLVNDVISNHEVWRQFLLDKNLIMEPKLEQTFSIGDRFETASENNHVWILASTGKGREVNLIKIEPPGDPDLGIRYSIKSVTVDSLKNITIKEFEELTGSKYEEAFRKIDKDDYRPRSRPSSMNYGSF